MTLSILIATHDDYDGLYFTVQSLRMHHDLSDVEIIVLDNNPGGIHSKAINHLCKSVKGIKVINVDSKKSSFVKYDGVDHVSGDVILGLDSHVLLYPEFISAMMEYWKNNPSSKNILSGPLLYDDLRHVSTHMNPVWRGEDFGIWGTDVSAIEQGRPFEVPMQGMGCYSFLRKSWMGISKEFRGFGGEEWYIAEKFRQNGGKSICHPKMKWVHRFDWPVRTFPLSLYDKIINYYRGWLELYKDESHHMIQDMNVYWTTIIDESKLKALIAKAKLPAEK